MTVVVLLLIMSQLSLAWNLSFRPANPTRLQPITTSSVSRQRRLSSASRQKGVKCTQGHSTTDNHDNDLDLSERQQSSTSCLASAGITRRQAGQGILATLLTTTSLNPSKPVWASETGTSPPMTATSTPFVSIGYQDNLAEYSNSITASRDTNISPREAYDVIRQQVCTRMPTKKEGGRPLRALDVGAGAGVSTAVLYYECGSTPRSTSMQSQQSSSSPSPPSSSSTVSPGQESFQPYFDQIDAIDWSAKAWDANVQQPLPGTVRFYELDDERFFAQSNNNKNNYNVIVYNFAINFEKAIRVAKEYLVKDDDNDNSTSLLLAPVNDKADYWYKQSYVLLNPQGTIVWKSEKDVGAWSIQFQPDVTSTTCSASIWCGDMNGFFQQQQQERNNQM